MELKLNSEQFQAALRAVLAGIIALLVAQTLRLENTYWCLLTVLILVQPRARATYQKGLYRILGTILGAGIAVALIGLFAQEHLLLFVSLAGFFFVIFYLMSGKLLPYSFLMAGFTLIMVISSGLQHPENSFITAIFRTTEICVGVAASIFITIWIWPQSAESSLRRTLKQLSLSLRVALAMRFHPEQGQAGGYSLEELKAMALSHVETIPVLADQVILEGSLSTEEQQRFLRSCHQWEALTLALFEWLDTPVELVTPRVQSGEQEELKKFAGHLELLLEKLGQEPGRIVGEERETLKSITNGLLDLLVKQREAGWSKRFEVAQNFAYYRVLEAVKNIVGCLETISLPVLRSDPTSHLSSELPIWTRLPELLWSDLRAPEPARLGLAIKTTALFLLMLLASQAAHLSFMLQSMISALLVLSQSTVGSTVYKSLLRLAGALGGGIFALLILIVFSSWMNSLAFLLVLLSLVMFASSYVANGPTSYSYLGVQVGMAFFLTMFSGFSPPTNLDPAINRFIGVVVGSAFAIFMTTSVLPTKAGTELNNHLARLREQLGRAFRRIRGGQGEAGDALAEMELKECQKELVQASNFLLHSRIEGALENERGKQSAKDLDQLRKVYHLLRDWNEVPAVLYKLPKEHTLSQTLEQAMNAIEGRLLNPAHVDSVEARQLDEAVAKARKEGTLVKWDAADVTAAGASMYLVGQLLSIGAPPVELTAGFSAEPLV